MKILVISGPNLNLVGTREPSIYGTTTLAEIEEALAALAADRGASVECRQSNHEGDLIDWLHDARTMFDGVVINAGGLTHTSVALRDAIVACEKPCIEVHLSNTHAREPFRRRSLLAPVVKGVVLGFGPDSYTLGLRGLIDYLSRP